MRYLDFPAVHAAPCHHEPYEYIVVPGFVRPEALDEIEADFPAIRSPGSFPLAALSYGPCFTALLEELKDDEFRLVMEQKLHVPLKGHPELITVRGQCRARDGKIHTDTESKIVSVLIYLNKAWTEDGGRIRVLNGPDSFDDCAEEIPPVGGTMLAFVRSPRSWHGHKPFAGRRHVVQVNWITDQASFDRELRRHRLSAFSKRMNPLAWLGSA
ncbi:MAG TPA: 2OG-Fe(II) oxygenase [Sphingomicrobium sp.]